MGWGEFRGEHPAFGRSEPVQQQLPRVYYPKYAVEWSQEAGGFVATCDWWPEERGRGDQPHTALFGLMRHLENKFTEEEACQRRQEINQERGYRC